MCPLCLLLSDCWPTYRERTQRSKSLEIARNARKAQNARNARMLGMLEIGISVRQTQLFYSAVYTGTMLTTSKQHTRCRKTSLNMLKMREMFILVLGAQKAFCAQWVFGCQDARNSKCSKVKIDFRKSLSCTFGFESQKLEKSISSILSI